ncbi:MAG TPA: hypothetical protein DDW49_05320, partial [Deltaproteobacteria bacterium]|nr:hypothetical protein [Deltaproteobacteria bacterium]
MNCPYPSIPLFLIASKIFPAIGPETYTVIHIKDGIIYSLGNDELIKQKNPDETIIDLTGYALFPGFVNAHSHLELTALGPVSSPASFVDWIRKLISQKKELTETEKDRGVKSGIKNMIKTGVTCVGDHISHDGPWETILNSPLRGRLFPEVLGVVPEISQNILEHLKQLKLTHENKTSLWKIHISPHSIHALDPEILKQILKEEPAPLSCHVAESAAEDELFRKGSGEMADFISPFIKGGLRGIWARLDSSLGPHSGLEQLIFQKLPIEKLLIVHGNYLSDTEIEIMSRHKMSVVHCPGSHAYFGHKKFLLEKLKDINISF